MSDNIQLLTLRQFGSLRYHEDSATTSKAALHRNEYVLVCCQGYSRAADGIYISHCMSLGLMRLVQTVCS